AFGASHRNTAPDRSTRHAFYGHVQTLALAGLHDVVLDPLLWMSNSTDDIKFFGLKAPYALLIAGCSPQHPEKRWPVASFRALAAKLLRQGITPVVIGTKDEAETNAAIARGLDVIDLTGRTALFDIPLLARYAVAAIGNDTGPMHMAAVTGCPLVMLFSNTASNIALHAAPFPEGTPHVANLVADNIGDIKVSDVFQAFLNVSPATIFASHKSC
ncbi:MAG: glycosyltransferase family 9 protein, partial [Pseudomonadota bacterium]